MATTTKGCFLRPVMSDAPAPPPAHCHFLRKAVYVALACFFLSRVLVAVERLSARDVAYAQSIVSETAQRYPSFTMCPNAHFWRDGGGDIDTLEATKGLTNMTEIYSRGGEIKKRLLWLHHSYMDEHQQDISFSVKNYTDPDFEKHVTVRLIPKYPDFDQVQPCLTYDPKGVSYVGKKCQVFFRLDTTGLRSWTVYAHDRGVMVPGLVGKYGRAYNTLRALGPKDYVDEGVDHENKFYYEVTRTECVYIPNEKVLCEENGSNEDFSTCVEKYIERRLNCNIPWIAGGDTSLRVCESQSDFGAYMELSGNISRLGENEMTQLTGCSVGCRRLQFGTRLISSAEETKAIDDQQPDKTSRYSMLFKWQYSNTDYVVRKEYLTYDENSLIADVGGYLGLLLGHSILNIFDVLVHACGYLTTLKLHRGGNKIQANGHNIQNLV